MTWVVPGYRHRADLGGGTGQVVLAVDESSGDLVVIKYLNTDALPALYAIRATVDEISALSIDYFVRIREFAEGSGHAAIVMDAVNGITIRALIRDDGAVRVEAALLLYRHTLGGLAYAHALDIVHGEMCPENVLVDAGGRPIILNAGAATWSSSEPTLSSGVYLAPERWRGGAPAPAADVYAATVTFVETLVGEPPYWEETDIVALRRRQEDDDIPFVGVPVALHDVVRVGMAKGVQARLDAAPLLDLVETVAVAEYGRDWEERGRNLLVERVRSLSLPFGRASAIEATEAGETEDIVNDDYYADNAVTQAPAPAGANGEAVVAAAAEIIELARLRDAAETDAMVAASVDEELTDEEERAVAEIERLVFLDKAADVTEASDTAADAAAVDAAAAAAVDGVAAETAEVETAEVEGVEVEGVAVEGVAVDGAAAEAPAEESTAARATGDEIAAEMLTVAGTSTAGGSGRFYRRHPWWTGFGAFGVVILVAGVLLLSGVGRSGPTTTPAAQLSTQPAAISPSSFAGPSSAPAPSGTASVGAPIVSGTPTSSSNGTPAPQPTLPVTGFAHPIRLMGAVAIGFVALGALLMYTGRRRDDTLT
jgi:serine/threonine-protein kinase